MNTLLKITLFAFTLALLTACVGKPVQNEVYATPATETTFPEREYQPRYTCNSCGTIERILLIRNTEPANRSGAVLGGVIGSIAGSESTSGAKPSQTPSNAQVEKSYDITIQMDNGRLLQVKQSTLAKELIVGSRIKMEGRNIVIIE